VEDIINQIDGKVRVTFAKVDDQNVTYRDMLWFTQEVYDTLTQTDIDNMKQERFDNWVNLRAAWVINPPVEETVVEETIIEETVVDTPTVTEEPTTEV
jgi:uncharacterized HAD superfamily protein